MRGISSDRAIGFGENKVLSMPDAIALREREKAGIQQELIPEAVGGRAEVVELPETLEQVALPLTNYAAEAETFMGTCPDCASQLECHAYCYSGCG